MKEIAVDKLRIKICEGREEIGTVAARMLAATVQELLLRKEEVNIIFAAAASQNEFLDALSIEPVDWSRVNAFHMDEYIGLPDGAPQSFSVYLRERLFDKISLKNIYYLKGYLPDVEAECKRYSDLLEEYPVDITCMGIGENAHLAFNDPHVADFKDPKLVKRVDLDEACKQQQVNEGCFDSVHDIPVYALTLTIPALMRASHIFCMVPGMPKAKAVYHTLMDEISENYPSTILRQHPNAWLFLEKESASLLPEKISFKVVNYN